MSKIKQIQEFQFRQPNGEEDMKAPLWNNTDKIFEFYSLNASGTELIKKTVTQVDHGFVAGDVVRADGDSSYTKAQADSEENSRVVGIVSEVLNDNQFIYFVTGKISNEDIVPNLPANTVLYLSTETPGSMTDVIPNVVGQVVKPLGIITHQALEMVFLPAGDGGAIEAEGHDRMYEFVSDLNEGDIAGLVEHEGELKVQALPLSVDHTKVIVKESALIGEKGVVTLPGGIAKSGGLVTINDIGKKIMIDSSNVLSLTTGDIIGKVVGENEFYYEGKKLIYNKVYEFLSNLSAGDIAGIVKKTGQTELKVDSIDNMFDNLGIDFNNQLDPVVFEEASTSEISSVFINENKVLIAYLDGGNNYYGTAIIATISDDSVTFGTPVVFNNSNTKNISLVLIDENKVLISYKDSGDLKKGVSIVCSISDDSVTFGTPVVFNNNDVNFISSSLIDTNKVLISYNKYNEYEGASIICTVSGDVPSFGTEFIFSDIGYTSFYISSLLIDINKVLIFYTTGYPNFSRGEAIVATISDDSVTFGTPVVFDSGYRMYTTSTLIDTNKVLVSFKNGLASAQLASKVCTVSGDVPSFGTKITGSFIDDNIISSSLIDTNKVLICYRRDDNKGCMVVATISDDSVTFGTSIVFNNAITQDISLTSINTNKILISYRNDGNASYGTSKLFLPELIDLDYSPCIVQETKTAGQSGEVVVEGGLSKSGGLITADDIGKNVFDNNGVVSLESGEVIGKVVNVDEFYYFGKNIYYEIDKLPVCRKAYAFTTDVVIEDTTETDLMSFTIPANTLGTDNVIEISMKGQFGNSGGYTNYFYLYLGETKIGTLTVTGISAYAREMKVSLYGAGDPDSQEWDMQLVNMSAEAYGEWYAEGTSSIDSTGDLTFRITGQKSNASGQDIIARRGHVIIIK